MQVDQLIHAKWLIPCNKPDEVLPDHALVIDKGLIIDYLPSREAETIYQAPQKSWFHSHAITPGFVNSHTHIAMNIFRGLADDLELMDWLNHHIWPAERKWVSEELVYDASQLAIAEMIRGGVTCFNDMYFFIEATAKAASEAGIRAHIGMTVIDLPTAWAKNTEEYISKGLDFYEAYKNHPLITPTVAPHSTYTVSTETLTKLKKIATDYHLRMNIHLQEAPSEIEQSLKSYQKRPIELLYEIGLLSSELIAIHMTQLNERDIEMIQRTGVQIVHCPESNMKLVSGICPVATLLDKNINVALGTDGAASNNDLDMIGEMRSAAFIGKLHAQNPKAIPAMTALQLATLNGAKALGKEKLFGSLAKGKSADFIAIDLEQIETLPLYHPISQIVYAASRHQVTHVWVAGVQLLKNRELLTLDEKTIRAKALMWRERIKP